MTVQDLTQGAADLVEEIGDRAAADLAAFRDAYRLGFETGVTVGEQRANAEILAEDEQITADRKMLQVRAELAALRSQPSGPAYYASVLRNGGTEFGGIGRPRVPIPAEVLDAARAWQSHEVQRQGAAA